MEIEKKYLVKELPSELSQYAVWEIEQCYLCTSPTVRIRRKNDDYILTYKSRVDAGDSSLCVAQETELPLTKDSYFHLREKADGKCIQKSRYRIPFHKWIIELDVFHGDYEGFCLAEVEFETIEESSQFIPPSWFGTDVSGDFHYTNSYLAQN